jgi:Universal stress protein family
MSRRLTPKPPSDDGFYPRSLLGRSRCERPPKSMPDVIVVCVDGLPGSYAAVEEIAELARRFEAALIALSVVEGLPKYSATMGEVDEFKRERDASFEGVGAQVEALADRHGVTLTRVVRVGPCRRRHRAFRRRGGCEPGGAGMQGTLARSRLRLTRYGPEGERPLEGFGIAFAILSTLSSALVLRQFDDSSKLAIVFVLGCAAGGIAGIAAGAYLATRI